MLSRSRFHDAITILIFLFYKELELLTLLGQKVKHKKLTFVKV